MNNGGGDVILDTCIRCYTDGNDENSKTMSSSSWARNLMSFLLFQILKEIHSKKVSIILKPGENSELRGEKERKHS